MSNVPKSSAGADTKNAASDASNDAANPAPRDRRHAPRDARGDAPRRDVSVNVANAPRSNASVHGERAQHEGLEIDRLVFDALVALRGADG